MSRIFPNRTGTWTLIAAVFLCCLQGTAQAQQTPNLRVGVYESPPFVVQKDDDWGGMAVEIWENLADELDYRYDYVPLNSYADLVDKTARNEIDVAVSNITITEARHRRISFTQPWFDGGLRLMVGTSSASGFWAVWEGLRDAGHLSAYGWLVLIITIGTIAFTLFDRLTNPEFPKRWPNGLAESFHSVMAIATSGQIPARKNRWGWPGRVGQALWLACGVAVLAYITSTVTSVMTALTLTGQVNSIADMQTRISGVLQGSTAEEYVTQEGLRHRSFITLSAAADAMEKREIEAIIGDAPVLEYFLVQNPDVHARMTGAIFKPEKYAFGVQLNSHLRRDISVGLTSAQEDLEVEALRLKYFGSRQ